MTTPTDSDAHRAFYCRECRQPVVICASCYRGQAYCGDSCRKLARQRSLRDAGRRYAASQRGRERAAERQRRRRQRCERASVTHQGCAESPKRAADGQSDAFLEPSGTREPRRVRPTGRGDGPERWLCVACGRFAGRYTLNLPDWPGEGRRRLRRTRRRLRRVALQQALA